MEKYYKKQEEFKQALLSTKGWEEKYLQEFSNHKSSWLTVRVKHLKKFKDLGMVNNFTFDKTKKGKEELDEFLNWINTPNLKAPKLYFEDYDIWEYNKSIRRAKREKDYQNMLDEFREEDKKKAELNRTVNLVFLVPIGIFIIIIYYIYKFIISL